MGDSDMPTPPTPPALSDNWKKTVVGFLKNAGVFKWFRPLLHNLGGRKFVLGGGALVVLQGLFSDGMVSWPKAVAGLAVAITTIGIAWTIASEDKAKKEGAGK